MELKPRFIFLLFVLTLTIFGCGGSGGLTVTAPNTSPTTPTTDHAVPAPSSVTADAGDGSVTLSWTPVSGAVSYNIYQGTTTGVTKTNSTKISSPIASPYAVNGLTNNSPYFFVVTTVTATGESAESTQVTATPVPTPPPAAPTGVIVSTGNGQVTVSWNAVAGATSNIYYSTTPGVTKTTGTKIAGASNPLTITGLNNGTTYYFVVTAVDSSGESAESLQVSAAPFINQPIQETGLTGVIGIAAGHGYTVALKNDGTVRFWGLNASHDGIAVIQVPGLSAVSAITNDGSLALKSDGSIFDLNNSLQVPGFTGAVSISETGSVIVTLNNNGTVSAWNTNPSAGSFLTTNSTPTTVTGLSGITAIATGTSDYALALKNDGTVWFWGNILIGQNVAQASTYTPIQVSGFTDVVTISGMAALKRDGTVWHWNPAGGAPIQVPGLSGAVAISGTSSSYGSYEVLALKSDGTVWDESGLQVPGLSGITAISEWGVALKNDGTVWQTFSSGWGFNLWRHNTPATQVPGLSGITAIKSGKNSSAVALKNDGTVWMWGLDYVTGKPR